MPKELQLKVFKVHIEMAMAHNLPLVLHLQGKVLDDARQLLKDTLIGKLSFIID